MSVVARDWRARRRETGAAHELTPGQLAAVERRDGPLFVPAAAGSGKTGVLAERFAAAAIEDGTDVDRILAITFTEKAAGEMRRRVRDLLAEHGREDEARQMQDAWVSTIHGFCARALRGNTLAAGIDPAFRVIDEVEAGRLLDRAAERALADWLGSPPDPARFELVLAHTADTLLAMARGALRTLRARGQDVRLPVVDAPDTARVVGDCLDAIGAALASLPDTGNRVLAARDRLGEYRETLSALGPGELPTALRAAGMEVKRGSAALRDCADLDAFDAARDALASVCEAAETAHLVEHLSALLDLLVAGYERLKRERSGLDFEDLQVALRDLVRSDERARARVADRFDHVLVDEFQDTNALQDELLDLIGGERLFVVGDESQAIYGFRGADVGVFRRRREAAEAAGRVQPLRENFRSSPEILDGIGLAFGGLLGDGFVAPEPPPSRERAPEGSAPAIELLLTAKGRDAWTELQEADPEPFGPTMRGVPPWRAAEARLLAGRVAELAGEGRQWRHADVVVLLRAASDLGVYERALSERGIQTYAIGGRGYFASQQVADVRAGLGALANPLDGYALWSALASPLCSLSPDALVGVRLELGYDPWPGLERALVSDPGGEQARALRARLEAPELERLAAFVRWLAHERAARAPGSLEGVMDRLITENGYDTATLALPGGDRRMANIRKLMRLARDYEADEGRDLRGFLDHLRDRDAAVAREGEAATAVEDIEAVRLMTIHAAKGLEFPVVAVADLGREPPHGRDPMAIAADGSAIGFRLASTTAAAAASAGLEALRRAEAERDAEEQRRLFYVAATRAQHLLVLSGATVLGEGTRGREPASWLAEAFAPGLLAAGGDGTPATGDHDVSGTIGTRPATARIGYRLLRADTIGELLPPEARIPAARPRARRGARAAGQPRLPAVGAAVRTVGRVSASSLERHARCGYRFHLERVAGLPELPDPSPWERTPGRLTPGGRGTVVHALLEEADFAAPRPVGPERVRALAALAGEDASDADVEDITALVARALAAPVAARLGAAARLRTELGFVFELPGTGRVPMLVNGRIDALAEEAGGVLIVDWKTTRLDDVPLAELVERHHGAQQRMYGLAALRGGHARVEVAHCFLERPEELVTRVWTAAEAAQLEQEVRDLLSGLAAGSFETAERPSSYLCAGCPGRTGLCRWSAEATALVFDREQGAE